MVGLYPHWHLLFPHSIDTLLHTERIFCLLAFNTGSPHPRTPCERRIDPREEMKLELTEEQDRRRLKGLRILARIIVRHRLAHPELYFNGDSAGSLGVAVGGEEDGGEKKT